MENNFLKTPNTWESLIEKNYHSLNMDLDDELASYWPIFRFNERLPDSDLRKKYRNIPLKIRTTLALELESELNAARANQNYQLASELISFASRYFQADFSAFIINSLQTINPKMFTPRANRVTRSKSNSFLECLLNAMDNLAEFETGTSTKALISLEQKTILLRGINLDFSNDNFLFCRWAAKAFCYDLRVLDRVASYKLRVAKACFWLNQVLIRAKIPKQYLLQIISYIEAELVTVNNSTFSRLFELSQEKSVDHFYDLYDLSVPSEVEWSDYLDIGAYYQPITPDINIPVAHSIEANGWAGLFIFAVNNYREQVEQEPEAGSADSNSLIITGTENQIRKPLTLNDGSILKAA